MNLKTVDIKGKAYVEVNERLRYFRENHDGFCLVSEILDLSEKRIIIKASILDKENRVVATGIAYEMEGSNYINKTSFVENCETSAWGRALANFGIGIDAAVASAQEVGNAIHQQENPAKKAVKKKATVISTEGTPASEPWMGHEWKDEKQRKLFLGMVGALMPVEEYVAYETFLMLTMNAAIVASKGEPKKKLSQKFIKHALNNMTDLYNEFVKE